MLLSALSTHGFLDMECSVHFAFELLLSLTVCVDTFLRGGLSVEGCRGRGRQFDAVVAVIEMYAWHKQRSPASRAIPTLICTFNLEARRPVGANAIGTGGCNEPP